METPTVQFVGVPCGQHGPYTFYKAFKYNFGKKKRILALSEFFFVKTCKDAPVCIGELQLIWQDKNNKQLLGSVRLYFLPEHTPDGRLENHGEDELLAESEKFVLKLEDLVDWIIEDVEWPIGQLAFTEDQLVGENCEKIQQLTKTLTSGSASLQLKEVYKEKKLIGDHGNDSTPVTILSYPQYCRYRTVLKRLEKVENLWLRNAIICAIGGFTSPQPNTRVLFCRDIFEHPELQFHDFRQDHWAPNLKGRPRKRKLFLKKEGQESESDNDSVKSLEKVLPNNDIKPKLENKRRTLKPKSGAEPEEKEFLRSLYAFMKDRNTPIERIPSLGFKQIDLFLFWTAVNKHGGYEKITQKRLWKTIYDQMGGNPANTSAATCTRRHYERLLLPFEESKRVEGGKFSPSVNRQKKKKAKIKITPTKQELADKENKTIKEECFRDTVYKAEKENIKLEIAVKEEPTKATENLPPVITEPQVKVKQEPPASLVETIAVKAETTTLTAVPKSSPVYNATPRTHPSVTHSIRTAESLDGNKNGAFIDTKKRGPSIMMPLKNKRLPIKKQTLHEYANYMSQKSSNVPHRQGRLNEIANSEAGVTNRPSVIQMASKTPPITSVHSGDISPARTDQQSLPVYSTSQNISSGITCSTISQQPSPAHVPKTSVTLPASPVHSSATKRLYPPFNEPPTSMFPAKSPSSNTKPKTSLPLPAHTVELSDGPYHEAVKRHCLQPGTSSGKYGTLSLPTKPGSLAHCQNLVSCSPKITLPNTCDQPQDLSTKKLRSESHEHVLHNQDEPLNLVKKGRQESPNVRSAPVAHQKPLPPHPGRMLPHPNRVASLCEGRTPPVAHQKDNIPKVHKISPSLDNSRPRGPPNRVAPAPAPVVNNSRLAATPVSSQRVSQQVLSHRAQTPNQLRTPTHPRALPSPVCRTQKTPLHPSLPHRSHTTPSRSMVTPPPSSHAMQRSVAIPQQQTPPSSSQIRLLQSPPNEVMVAPPASTYMRPPSQPSTHKLLPSPRGDLRSPEDDHVHPAFGRNSSYPSPSFHSPPLPAFVHPYSTQLRAQVQATPSQIAAYGDFIQKNGIHATAVPYIIPTDQTYTGLYLSPSTNPRETT